MSSFMNGISLRSFSRSLLVLLLLSFLISGLGFASNAGAQTPAGTPPIITFSFDPPAPVQSVEILPDGTLNPPYLCNPDPKINTGYLFRFLAGELDAFQNNEAPNATNLPSLESLLGQLKDRVTVESDKYSKTPAIPTGSTSVTLNDCYTDAEWKLFQTTFGQVACNWLRHFNAPHLCAPELQQQAASNPPVAPAVTVQDNTPPVITLNGPPEIVVEMGTTYTDKGATASDNIDGDITSRIKERYPPIDTSTLTAPRTYQLTYNVSDSAGNAATPVTRIVRVQDTTAPVITLKRTEPDIPKIYTVQVAAVTSAKKADQVVRSLKINLKINGIEDLYVVKSVRKSGRTWYEIRFGHFNTKEQASKFADRLINEKIIKNYFLIALPK